LLTQLIQTPVGCLAAEWNSAGLLYACSFTTEPLTTPDSGLDRQHASMHLLQRRLEDYFAFGSLAWDLDLLDWSDVSSFNEAVLRACFRIPSGRTLSYARLAAQAGKPKAARAVGGAMARNRWPIIIPCHRVVGSRGQLTGYSGTGGLATKRQLLDLESQAALQTS
jgi:methylated-DNA-[protein]-cysteine S-methyltransferase